VVILANNDAGAKFSSGQLSVVLCHELFHLWVPNALLFRGDYAWFYEGFTLYQALCTAVRLGLVDFPEYLATLGRVYSSYRIASEANNQSLLAASERRWTSGGSLVYDQGMLVGFLCDLKLRRIGREGLDVVYRSLMRDYSRAAKDIDANQAIIRLLAEQTGDEQFVRRYIESPARIEFESVIPDYGMRIVNTANQRQLQVSDQLNTEQLELLVGLGYRKRRR
jgi:predicted metalloprotease with PDZ domain